VRAVSRPVRVRLVLVGIALAIGLVGCGDDDDAEPAEADQSDASVDDATPSESTTSTAESTTTTTESTTTTTAAPAPPMPLDDQSPPAALNGLEVDGDTIWVASTESAQVVQFDRTTGEILTRIDTSPSQPDDVTVGPDGAVYWTGFNDGEIGRIVDGASESVANIGPGANPLGFTPDGRLFVGRAVTGDDLWEVPLDGGEPTMIAGPVGDMNAFVVEADRVVGPTGGIAGPGGVAAVDLASGEVTDLGGPFEAPVTASDVEPDGVLHLLSFDGRVWRFDETTWPTRSPAESSTTWPSPMTARSTSACSPSRWSWRSPPTAPRASSRSAPWAEVAIVAGAALGRR